MNWRSDHTMAGGGVLVRPRKIAARSGSRRLRVRMTRESRFAVHRLRIAAAEKINGGFRRRLSTDLCSRMLPSLSLVYRSAVWHLRTKACDS